MPKRLTHGELFAGIGGFGLGFEPSGIETAWRVEIDRDCQRVLRRRYPDVLLFNDVRECHSATYLDKAVKKEVLRELPAVDIISGGFP